MKLSKVGMPEKSLKSKPGLQPVAIKSKFKLAKWEKPEEETREFIAILADGRRIAVVRRNWLECMRAVIKQNPVKVQYESPLDKDSIMSFRCEGGTLHFEELIRKKTKLQKV